VGMYIHDDVRTLTAGLVREQCGRLPNVIVGSPPCQDASCANSGGRGVDGERTGLFFEAIRIVGECRPVWGCFENAASLRVRGADRIIGALEAIGYSVWPFVVSARNIGAEHHRSRAWFLFADANCTKGEIGEGVSEDDGGTSAPIKRSPARSWDDLTARAWCSLRAFDGIPNRLATAIADAYGDAIVPQIAEAIGRSMMRLAPTDGTVLDLFAGAAGGWSLGMQRAGYRIIAACEVDPWRRAVIEARHNGKEIAEWPQSK
jgi:site-specific DNA-cytosine methylase